VPVFVNLLRSPGIDFQTFGPVRQPYLSYRLARLHRLAKSIPGLLKRLQIRAQAHNLAKSIHGLLQSLKIRALLLNYRLNFSSLTETCIRCTIFVQQLHRVQSILYIFQFSFHVQYLYAQIFNIINHLALTHHMREEETEKAEEVEIER
jgi:hypothetical protein